MRRDYINNAINRSAGAMKNISVLPAYSNYQERFPELYRDLPTNPQNQSAAEIRTNNTIRGNLTTAEYELVRKIAASNPAFEKALRMNGMARRESVNNVAGSLLMPSSPISRQRLAAAIGALHKDVLIPALEGTPSYYRPISSQKAEDQQRISNSNSADVLDAISAMNQLSSLGILPIYRQPMNAKPKESFSVVSEAAPYVKPHQYQIMSLTLEDFKKGVLLDPKQEAQTIYEERPRGVSTNKMIGESSFTRLIGMHGHNTLGNGSKIKNDHPAMIQIDLSQSMFEKDKNGELVWENGQPKMSAQGKKEVGEMFIPAKGKDYPIIPWGGKDPYVPVTAKNGVVTAVREQDYISAVQKSKA